MEDVKYWCECINLLSNATGVNSNFDYKFYINVAKNIRIISDEILQPMINDEIKNKENLEKLYPVVTEEIKKLTKELDLKEKEHTQLVEDYNDLQRRYKNLIDNNSELMTKYRALLKAKESEK